MSAVVTWYFKYRKAGMKPANAWNLATFTYGAHQLSRS